jgi:hypothetical protein
MKIKGTPSDMDSLCHHIALLKDKSHFINFTVTMVCSISLAQNTSVLNAYKEDKLSKRIKQGVWKCRLNI